MPASQMLSPAAPRSPGRPPGVDSVCQDRLLTVAISSFARLGFESVSLRSIANAAGFNVSMVSHYFGSKLGLWQAVVDTIALDQQDMLHELKELNRFDQPWALRTTTAIDLMLDHLAANPEAFMFVARGISEPNERLDYLIDRLLRPYNEACLPLWREAMAAGLLRPIDPMTFHIGLIGGLAMLIASRPVLAQFEGKEMSLEQLKLEMHKILNLG